MSAPRPEKPRHLEPLFHASLSPHCGPETGGGGGGSLMVCKEGEGHREVLASLSLATDNWGFIITQNQTCTLLIRLYF